MKHSIINNLKGQLESLNRYLFADKYITSTTKCLKKVSLGLLAIFLLSSAVVGCGLNKNSRFGPYGYGGQDGYRHVFGQNIPGHIIDTATGYNMNGHQIQLEFRRVDFTNSYDFNSVNSRGGLIDIQGEVVFGDSINSSTNYYNYASYGGGNGYHDPRYGGGHGYDPCYIQPNQYLRVYLEPQFGYAHMEGNDFGNYELLAQGQYGELIRLSPVNPAVGASFLLGHNNPNGEVNLFMDVIVQRIDSPDAYCPERRVTFGS